MNPKTDNLYAFVFKGLLTEEALDRAVRQNKNLSNLEDVEIAKSLSINLLDEDAIASAKQMAIVYTAIAAFENSVRNLIKTALMEKYKEEWWKKGVSESIRKKAESRMQEEKKIKWHTQRGDEPLNYTDLGHLGNVINNNIDVFEPFVQNVPWATSIFKVVERSRNVIMHSGVLGKEDIDRLGINIRDWIKQVGA